MLPLPFGGTAGSGFGRELGAQAVRQYTESKTTVLDTTVRAPAGAAFPR